MSEKNKLTNKYKIPKVLFCAVDLCRITGGITVLARLIFRSLTDMHLRGKIKLQAQVLNESGPDPNDELMQDFKEISIRWCSESRVRFTMGILTSKPDLVIFDHAGPSKSAKMLPAFVRPSYCVFIHGVEIDEQARPDYTKALEGATLLIANSNYTKSRVHKLGTNLPKIEVCRPGLDYNEKKTDGNIDTPLLSNIGSHAILIVGRMDASQCHKGHDYLIECMPEIIDQVPDAQLIIVGDGDDMERLKQKAETSGIKNSIFFTGRVSNDVLHALYEKCAVFVMPSKGDGFGFVYLEAMSHKKPCIGLLNSAAAEIIEHKVTGLLIDRDQKDEMTASIASLLKDTPLREKMGKAGFQRLHTIFLYEHFNRRLNATLGEVLL
ncbi:glycosyltransferase family 4 protein [Thermodesulfobacteriota bacterium]